jgi:tRNA pseudouridine55 synthase
MDAFSLTDDSDGPFEPAPVANPPGLAEVQQAVAGFVGTVLQQPPSFSRVHAAPGKRSDRLARKASRKGAAVDRPAARPVNIYAIDVLGYAWPNLQVRVTCGRGTYIRSLARDLGMQLSTGGYLSGLVRERIGPFEANDAVVIPPDRPIYPEEAVGWLARLQTEPQINTEERG